jgi:hypothetical protein
LDSTEPANYTGSYTTVSKEIIDIEIAMRNRNAPELKYNTLVTATQVLLSLLKLTVSEEQEEKGGLRN